MVNLENQGVMTEYDAVHGISTSELFNTKPLNFRGFFISVHFNFFSTFLQRLAYLSLLSFSVSFQTKLIHKNT